MKKQKSTKRALLMSALSLLLCLSMLVGTTFAWFTDSVTSGKNRITAGNLDVELEYLKNGEWVDVDGASDVLTNTLWEPGVTEVAYLRVANAGSLALKYQFGINILSEKAGVNVAGKEFKLSDYIQFGVIEGVNGETSAYANREDAVNAVTGAKLLNEGYTKATFMNANEELYLALVVWMPTSVGNEANHKTAEAGEPIDKYQPEIELGINIFATQYTEEDDSYGDDYDDNAWMPQMKVYTADDLQDALENAEPGTEIVLENDIDLDNGAIIIPAPEATTFAMRATPKPVVINLNGKKLNNPNGYVIENYGHVLITGDGTVSGLGGIRSHAGSVVIEDGNFYASSRWQDGVYQHTLKAENSTVLINGGNFDATKNGQTNAMFNASENAVITINGGNFKNVAGALTQFDPYIFTYEKNGQLIINDGTFYGGWRFNGADTTTDIYGGNFTVGFDGQSFHADSTHVVTVYGGTFTAGTKLAGKLNEIVAADYKAVDNGNGIYVVVPENVDTVILTAADLLALSAKAFTGNNGQAETYTIMLGADIDMNGADFSAIIAQRGDTLTFIGNGHIISNVNIISGADDNTTGQASMFYCYPNSTLNVSNLILKDITVTSDADAAGYAAAVIGYCEGAAVLNNVDVVNATIKGVKSSGLMAGHMSGSLTATDCDVTGTVTLVDFAAEANGHYAGKYLGTMAGAVALNNCTVEATVSGNLHANNIGDIYGRKVSGSLLIDGKTVASSAADVANGGEFVLAGNVQSGTAINKNTSIDLAGNTFEATGTVNLTGNADLTMTDGDYVVNGTYGHIDVRPDSAEGSTLLFENVDFSYNKLEKTYGPSTNRLGSVVEICATAADAKSVVVFRNCTFDNAQVLIEGLSGKTGIVDVTFENCTFNALTSSAPIKVDNYVTGKVTVTGCTFNLQCTSSVASAVSVSSSTSTVIELIASNNTINAIAATASGENGTVEQVKVNGTPANIKFISAYENCTVTETGTVKTGIAG